MQDDECLAEFGILSQTLTIPCLCFEVNECIKINKVILSRTGENLGKLILYPSKIKCYNRKEKKERKKSRFRIDIYQYLRQQNKQNRII